MTQDSPAKFGAKVVARVDSSLKEIIPGFLENRWKDTYTIITSVEQLKYETIRILGHDMRGVGSGYGFDVITDIGKSLEMAAKIKDPVEIRKLVRELATYLERVEIVYE